MSAAIVGQLTGLVPVVASGGVAMKFTEGVFGTPARQQVRKKKRSSLTSPKVFYNSPF